MSKIFNLLFYYILILLGLIITSWIIWSCFIRERTIRDIPDPFLTEYRFWILLYICCIYIYVIKSFFKPKDENVIIKEILNIIYKPLITLDQFIKYNKYIKSYYYIFMIKLVGFISVFKLKFYYFQTFIYLMQIVPRIILVTFLLVDTFYFHRLEIFYKVILIGLLPFIWQYIKYSLKDLYEQWILELENRYDGVRVYEEGYQFDKNRKGNTDAIFHHENKTIREYIEIKVNNIFLYIGEELKYKYESSPYCFSAVLAQYYFEKYEFNKGKYKYNFSPYTEEFFRIKGYDKFFAHYKSIRYSDEYLQKEFDVFISEKYIFDKYKFFINVNNYKKLTFNEIKQLSSKDYSLLKELYYDLMPSIINLNLLFYRSEIIDKTKFMFWSKMVIFSSYLICWSYILIISYFTYPVELIMGKYFLINFIGYLCLVENPFAELYWGSLNENLITIENIKCIMKKIMKRFFE